MEQVDSSLIAYSLAYAIMVAILLFALDAQGILGFADTLSDEHNHFLRTGAAQEIFSGHVTSGNLSALYDQGIWPPLYPLVVGLFNRVLGLNLYGDRILNVLFAASGMYLMGLSIRGYRRLWAIAVALLMFLFSPEYFQIRPENLALLLLGVITYVTVKAAAFRRNCDPPMRIYVILGSLFGLLPLTHATYMFVAAYGLCLTALSLRHRWPFAVALLAVTTPYLIVQNLMVSRLTLFATTSEEGLVRNNNPYWNAGLGYIENIELTFPKLLLEVRERIAQGDVVRFKRPRLIPTSHYEQWLNYENKRRIFGSIALATIRSDPLGYLLRIPRRLASVAFPALCPKGPGPYSCRLVPPAIVTATWAITLLFGAVACAVLWRRERNLIFAEFTYLGVVAALFLPMICITALWRQFLLLPILLIVGMLCALSNSHADQKKIPVN